MQIPNEHFTIWLEIDFNSPWQFLAWGVMLKITVTTITSFFKPTRNVSINLRQIEYWAGELSSLPSGQQHYWAIFHRSCEWLELNFAPTNLSGAQLHVMCVVEESDEMAPVDNEKCVEIEKEHLLTSNLPTVAGSLRFGHSPILSQRTNGKFEFPNLKQDMLAGSC